MRFIIALDNHSFNVFNAFLQFNSSIHFRFGINLAQTGDIHFLEVSWRGNKLNII